MSITGDSPLTVIVSSRLPTLISAFTAAVNEVVSSIPSRLTVAKPVRLKVTEYVPGRSSTIRYVPALSVVTVRTFSIRAGLAASTVTPGRTAPELSLTTPAMLPVAACAHTVAGSSRRHPTTARRLTQRVIRKSSLTVGLLARASRPGYQAFRSDADVTKDVKLTSKFVTEVWRGL